MKKIRVSVIDKDTLKILENANIGDVIDLKDVMSVDTSSIDSFINEAIEQKYKDLLQANKIQYDTKLKEIETKNQLLISEINKANQNDLFNLKQKNFEEIDNLKTKHVQEMNDLSAKIRSLEDNSKLIEEKINLEINAKYLNEINSLNLELEKEKEKYASLVNKTKIEVESKLLLQEKEIASEYNKQIDILKEQKQKILDEYNKIYLQKSTLGTKQLGEELEKRCTQEFEHAQIYGFKNCIWKKDNVSIKDENDVKGSKADFTFRIYSSNNFIDENILSSVCLEMKNESNVSTSKKKNSDYFKKLDEDRRKKKCEYALLVSELEWDSENDSPIKVVNEYEKMFIVRPQYMITFLGLIYSLSIKFSDVLNSSNRDKLQLKSSIELVEEFDKLKNTYIEKPLKSLESNLSLLMKNNDAIISAANANKILIDQEIIKSLNTIKEKIERFDIKKIEKKLIKIESE